MNVYVDMPDLFLSGDYPKKVIFSVMSSISARPQPPAAYKSGCLYPARPERACGFDRANLWGRLRQEQAFGVGRATPAPAYN